MTPAEQVAEPTAATQLAETLRDWDRYGCGSPAAVEVVDAARALLADHGRLLQHRAEAIAALTAERDRAVTGVRVLDDLRTAEIRDLAAERDRLAAQVQRVRELADDITAGRHGHGMHGTGRIGTLILTALDGGGS